MFIEKRKKTSPDHSAKEFDGAVAWTILLSLITTGIVVMDAGLLYLIAIPMLH